VERRFWVFGTARSRRHTTSMKEKVRFVIFEEPKVTGTEERSSRNSAGHLHSVLYDR
jgi:hypothetical protein